MDSTSSSCPTVPESGHPEAALENTFRVPSGSPRPSSATVFYAGCASPRTEVADAGLTTKNGGNPSLVDSCRRTGDQRWHHLHELTKISTGSPAQLMGLSG